MTGTLSLRNRRNKEGGSESEFWKQGSLGKDIRNLSTDVLEPQTATGN